MSINNIIRKVYNSKNVPYQINAFILAFSVAILCIGIFTNIVKGDTFYNIIRLYNFQFIVSISILLIIISFLPEIVVKLTHIILLLSLSASYFYLQYNNPYALIFWILICILMYRYGFLKKYALLKIIVLCLFLLTCIELSIYKAHLSNTGVGIEIVLFLFVFLAIIYIAYKEELDKILFYEKKAKKLINETIEENTQLQTLIKTREQEKKLLEAQMQSTKQKLKLIDQELIKLKKKEEPFDLERCNLTRREYKIIEYLVTEKASNKEIAKKFTITIPTVKKHFTNIYDKIGVDDRHHLIELCRNNFV